MLNVHNVIKYNSMSCIKPLVIKCGIFLLKSVLFTNLMMIKQNNSKELKCVGCLQRVRQNPKSNFLIFLTFFNPEAVIRMLFIEV